MRWRLPWKRLFARRTEDPTLGDKQVLLDEIRAAHAEWQHAMRRLDYALGADQVDYAIFALEAAEKRYEMLLKNAKRLNVRAIPFSTARAAEG